MAENVRIRTPRLFQSIREDGESPIVQRARRQVPPVVGGLGETDHQGVVPDQDGGVDGDRAEGNHIAKKLALGDGLDSVNRIPSRFGSAL
jgi:hypothetical protein